jgi:hypothetical protein
MRLLIVPLVLTCGPALLSTFALVRTLKDYRGGRIGPFPACAVVGAWLVTAYAAYVFLRYTVKPSPDLPPWKDSKTLELGLLFLLAPLGLISTIAAGVRGSSRWVVVPLVVECWSCFSWGFLRELPYMSTLSIEIDDSPVFISLLKVTKSESRQLCPAKVTTKQK